MRLKGKQQEGQIAAEDDGVQERVTDGRYLGMLSSVALERSKRPKPMASLRARAASDSGLMSSSPDHRLGDLEAGELDPLHDTLHGPEPPTPAYVLFSHPRLANSCTLGLTVCSSPNIAGRRGQYTL